MSKKRVKKPAKGKPEPAERASPETEAKFPSYLHPIIQCKHSVLTRSRLEFYGGIAYSAIVWVMPVSGVTRSLILLFALAPLVDAAWRSPWTHALMRVSKVRITIILLGIYCAIATSMILHDHGAVAETIKTYLIEHAERFTKWFYVIGGAVGFYILTKLLSLVKSYANTRRVENLATRQRAIDSHPGWLDYRLDAEASSRELHSLVARMCRAVKLMAAIFTHKSWFIGKEEKGSPIVRTEAMSWLLAFGLNKSSDWLEPDLEALQSNATLFIASTKGHLKTATKQGDLQVAELYEYFQAQLKDIREVTNAFSQFPPTFAKAKGTSRTLNAALDRALGIWNSEIEVLRKIEGHCAHMVKLTQAAFERVIEKPLKQLASTLVETAEMMVKDTTSEELKQQVRDLRSMARSAGIPDRSS
jgi:hypothetical protein